MSETMADLQEQANALLKAAGIILRPDEVKQIELTDLGLNDFFTTGLALYTYENNDRYCAKELILFPNQTCPQHRHPPIGSDPGKRETFRCRQGTVWLYVEGEASPKQSTQPPQDSSSYYTVFHEIELHPGDQYTIEPNTWHWFKSGNEGAIVSEFSSTSRDELDDFSDPRIQRVP